MKLTSLAEQILMILENCWNENSYLEKVYKLNEATTVTAL